MHEICKKCNTGGDDLRTLWMSCFYDMAELEIPFNIQTIPDGYTDPRAHKFFTLRVCKECRSDWMTMIRTWWKMPPYKQVNSPGTGIFIRELGCNVEITEEEFYKRKKEAENHEKSS